MDIFSKYNWTALTLKNVAKYKTAEPGYHMETVGHTKIYQLGIKFGGSTEIFYDRKKYMYNDGTIIYLPQESREDVEYKKTIIEQSSGISIFFNSTHPLHDKPELINCGDIGAIKEMFVKLANVYSHCDNQPDLECMSIFYKLLSKIRDYSIKPESIRLGKKRIEPSMEYIKEHFCDEYIEIEPLAKLSDMTPEYFRHKFKALYGISLLQYINHLKINYAKKLLLNHEYTINQVGSLVGFSNSNYFSRVFRQSTGITPTEYRKNYNDIAMF